MNTVSHIASAIGERATFAFIISAIVIAIAGVPTSKARYRTLVAGLTALALFATVQWYVTFIVGSYYAKATQGQYLVFMVVFAVLFFLGLFEAVSLHCYKRRTAIRGLKA